MGRTDVHSGYVFVAAVTRDGEAGGGATSLIRCALLQLATTIAASRQQRRCRCNNSQWHCTPRRSPAGCVWGRSSPVAVSKSKLPLAAGFHRPVCARENEKRERWVKKKRRLGLTCGLFFFTDMSVPWVPCRTKMLSKQPMDSICSSFRRYRRRYICYCGCGRWFNQGQKVRYPE